MLVLFQLLLLRRVGYPVEKIRERVGRAMLQTGVLDVDIKVRVGVTARSNVATICSSVLGMLLMAIE